MTKRKEGARVHKAPIRPGDRFGLLVAISKTSPGRWLCACDCGEQSVKWATHLHRGNTRSCGCSVRRHGHAANETSTLTYSSWTSMRSRCRNPKDPSYASYGGRGISVCARWADFALFLEDMGERPSPDHSLDRLDVNGDYEPANCRWATRRQQSRNTRRAVRFTAHGETLHIEDWASRLGCKQATIRARIRNGWPVERAVSEPVRHHS